MPSFGKTVTWTERDSYGSTPHEVRISDGETEEDAVIQAFVFARRCGWKPRRWWQWWRWCDTPNPTVESLLDALLVLENKKREALNNLFRRTELEASTG